MPFIIRDENGAIVEVRPHSQQEEVPLDHPELLAHFGVPEAVRRRGRAFLRRDPAGVVVAVNDTPDDEQLPDDHPEVVAFTTAHERVFARASLNASAAAAFNDAVPPLEQSRLALQPDTDPDKQAAQRKAAEINDRLKARLAEIDTAATPEAVQAVRW